MNNTKNELKSMNKTEINEKIVKVLTKMGYAPQLNEDNDVFFRYQLKWVQVLVLSDEYEEHPLLKVILARIYELDDDNIEERMGALIVSNCMTYEKTLTKVIFDLNFGVVNAYGTVVYTSERALKLYLEALLSGNELGNVTSEFRRRMENLRINETEKED